MAISERREPIESDFDPAFRHNAGRRRGIYKLFTHPNARPGVPTIHCVQIGSFLPARRPHYPRTNMHRAAVLVLILANSAWATGPLKVLKAFGTGNLNEGSDLYAGSPPGCAG